MADILKIRREKFISSKKVNRYRPREDEVGAMGASTSTEQQASSEEQREVESIAASTGALPMLHKAFSKLADSETNAIPVASLQKCFHLTLKNSISEASVIPKCFPGLLNQLGAAIVDLFFVAQKGGFNWIEFVRGYVKCCGRMSTSMSLNNLVRVFTGASAKAGLPSNFQVESEEDVCKISGSLAPNELRMLLLMCWTLLGGTRFTTSSEEADIGFPDIDHLILSAVLSCNEAARDLNVWDCDIVNMEVELPAGMIQTWAFKTVPHLADCLSQFLQARLQYFTTLEDGLEPPSLSLTDVASRKICGTHILTCGRAWAISLALRNSDEIMRACFPNDDLINEILLYRSSLHGKGLNRFWSKIEGYSGPTLLLISATSGDNSEGNGITRNWIVGALIQQTFENKDAPYGSSGNLFALSPVFDVISPSGREKNFVYSHLHPSGRGYDPHPKPVGIGFGGTVGNERLFLDEDFARVTLRHHAVDKTYGHGSLIPNQGFLPVEGMVSDVEVLGMGGKTAKELQSAYQKREQLFTEQRRKIDLKTFSNWEDSPEKMMMDMMSAPSSVRREAR